MRNKERNSSPRSRGEVAGTKQSEVEVDGGKVSSKLPITDSYPPSPSAFFQNAPGTSPPSVSKETQERGEKSTALPSTYPFTPYRNLTVSALHYFLSPGQKIRDVSRA